MINQLDEKLFPLNMYETFKMFHQDLRGYSSGAGIHNVRSLGTTCSLMEDLIGAGEDEEFNKESTFEDWYNGDKVTYISFRNNVSKCLTHKAIRF